MTSLGDLEQAQRRRAFDQQRHRDTLPEIHVVHGTITIPGPAQAIHPITFPVLFTEKPVPSFDAELNEKGVTVLVTGSYPSVVPCIVTWDKKQTEPGVYHYKGVKVAFTVTGMAGMLVDVNFRFEGMGFSIGVPDGGVI